MPLEHSKHRRQHRERQLGHGAVRRAAAAAAALRRAPRLRGGEASRRGAAPLEERHQLGGRDELDP
eukprot:scaffold65824_cov69-Phaeocystis_antarctica.AAC.9